MTNPPNWMIPKSALQDRFPLDVQSRGRPLTESEQAFADALEAAFASGIHDLNAVADALNASDIDAPGGGTWTVDVLVGHLADINRDLDAAFEEDGYGA